MNKKTVQTILIIIMITNSIQLLTGSENTNKSIPLIEIEKVPMALDSTGFPTIQALHKLLRQKYFPQLPDDQLTVNQINAGFASHRIYCASVKNKPVFFLKISSNYGAPQNLKDLQEGYIGRLGIEARYADTNLLIPRRNLPVITWLEKFFIYTDNYGKEQIIEVIHAAQGKSVADILKNEPLLSKETCLFAVGKALGSFQQAFMKYNDSNSSNTWRTVRHGDLHASNMFFDEINSRVYFIDNETMLDNSPIRIDFLFLITSIGKYTNSMTLDYDTNEMILARAFTAFIQGYIRSFPISKRAPLTRYLEEYLPHKFHAYFREP